MIQSPHPRKGVSPRGAAGWLRLALLFVMLGFSVMPVILYYRTSGRDVWDYTLWYRTGIRYRQGEDIYPRNKAGEFEFIYPPSAASLLAPLTLAGQLPMILVMLLVTSGSWMYSIRQSVSLSTGGNRRPEPLLTAIPSLCVLPYIFENYKVGQPTMILLACLLGAFASLRANREPLAGILLGLTAAIKAFPLLVLPYFIVRGYWKATAYTCGTLIFFLFVTTLPYRRPSETATDLGVWSSGMMKFDADGFSQRRNRSVSYKNGSLISIVIRYCRPVIVDPGPPPLRVNVFVAPFGMIHFLIVLSSVALGGLFLFLLSCGPPANPLAQAAEYSALLILVLLASPLSFVTYSYAWMLLPFTVVMASILDPLTSAGARRWMIAVSAVTLVLLAFTLPISWFRIPRALGNTFWASLLLLGQLAWIMLSARKRAQADSSPVPILCPAE